MYWLSKYKLISGWSFLPFEYFFGNYKSLKFTKITENEAGIDKYENQKTFAMNIKEHNIWKQHASNIQATWKFERTLI